NKLNYNLLYNSYINLGNASAGLNNYSKAIEYYQKAIETAKNLKSDANNLSFQLEPLNYISRIYQKQKLYKESVTYAERGLQIKNTRSREPAIYCYLSNNLAYSNLQLGSLSSAAPFFETLNIGDSLQSFPIQITSKTYLGEYYLKQNDKVKSRLFLNEARSQAHKNQLFEDELKILMLLADANPNLESFYKDRYIALSDSLHNVERAIRNKFARIE